MSRLHLKQTANGWFSYRRRWPTDLAKGEYIRTMGTQDRAEALRRRPHFEIMFNDEVERRRRSIDLGERTIGNEEVRKLFARWLAAEQTNWLDGEPPTYDDEKHADRSEAVATWAQYCRADLARRNFQRSESDAIDFLKSEGIKPDIKGEGFRFLCELILRGWSDLSARHIRRLAGDYGYGFSDPEVIAADRDANASLRKPRRTLGDLIAEFELDGADRWAPSTKSAHRTAFKVLRDVLGPSREVSSINREDGRTIFNAIKNLPAGWSKKKEFAGLSLKAVIDRAKRTDAPRLNAKSVNDGYMCHVVSLFKWAQNETWIAANPVAGLTMFDPVDPNDKRDPFTVEQLETLFSSPPWRQPYDAAQNAIDFWAPLIALFHGLRRSEIAQLDVADIVTLDGHPAVIIRSSSQDIANGREDGGKRLKTRATRRTLPLHPELLKMGFMKFVALRRETSGRKLFPGERPDSRGKWGRNAGNRFSVRIRAFSGVRLGLHSFRHNFEDALREAGLHGTPIGNVLSGRAAQGVAAKSYGSGFKIEKLLAALSTVNYPALDLTHLIHP